MQMRSRCFYSVVMTNSKLDYCHSGVILSLSVIYFFSFSFYVLFPFIDFYVFLFLLQDNKASSRSYSSIKSQYISLADAPLRSS